MVLGGCGWFWVIVHGCGWFWVVVDGFGSFLILVNMIVSQSCTKAVKLCEDFSKQECLWMHQRTHIFVLLYETEVRRW